MIITTTYTETITITTADDGTRTTSRSSHADTVAALLFRELSPAAQERAISDAIAGETDPAQWYVSHTCFAVDEIWQCAEDIERQQPISLGTDQGGSPYATARGTGWYSRHAADWQRVTEATDNGVCYSMDMCDIWNAFAARIVALQEAYEEATDEVWRLDEEADRLEDLPADTPDALRDAARDTARGIRAAAAEYERISYRIENAAEELTEEAARAVGDTLDGLIEAERDYYQSADFWREWLDDGETRFYRDGARI